ncbi:MAG: hypothetical protein Q4G46_05960, partial [Propionibacteriaceae bacterium]|nr:hypothetical protein [Propionibacteriaceae bacterium]
FAPDPAPEEIDAAPSRAWIDEAMADPTPAPESAEDDDPDPDPDPAPDSQADSGLTAEDEDAADAESSAADTADAESNTADAGDGGSPADDPRPARALSDDPTTEHRIVPRQRGADIHHLPARARRPHLGFMVGGLATIVVGITAIAPHVLPVIASAVPSLAADEVTKEVAVPKPAAPVAQAPVTEVTVPPVTSQSLNEISVVAGIPQPCSIDFRITDDMSAAQIADGAQRQWGFELTGPQWRANDYRPVVKLFAETLDAVDCTDYLDRVKAGNGGGLEISSLPTRSWAWGDYGLTRTKTLTLDFEKFRQGYADGDRGRLVRLIIHELAHSLNADRHSEPAYWQAYNKVWTAKGPVSSYGSNSTESFADAVGYYVARCAADNPFDSNQHAAYYDYVKSNIFGGREFGGAVGTQQSCAVKGR